MREESEDYLRAIATLGEGFLVVVPTETVYGLAADAYDSDAVAKIYATKGRPAFNPLIFHYFSAERVLDDVETDERFGVLAKSFWPGPLTLVLRRKEQSRASSLATAGLETLAVRVPSHPVFRALLESYPRPLAAPSANPTTRISPTTLMQAQTYFKSSPYVKAYLEGGASVFGIESTVVDLSGSKAQLLRPGIITQEEIESVIGPILGLTSKGAIKSPGQMKKHYAPSIPVRLNATFVRDNEALLAFGPTPLEGAGMALNLSEAGDLLQAASHLFSYLHALDNPRFQSIAVMPIPNEGVGVAINDRLSRASARENEDEPEGFHGYDHPRP